VPDFPKPGIVFKDLSPLLADGAAFGALVRDIGQRWQGRVDAVAGIEARGFIFGAAVAHDLGLGFVPIRKAGKLPGDTIASAYSLEYGTAEVEVQADAFTAGARVLLIDDVLATGGTAAAACELIGRAGAVVAAAEFVVELGFLDGRARLADESINAILTV
jgi:adenine phosphoribosyltransferase